MKDIIEKIEKDVPLTNGDVFKFLSFFCNEIRKDNHIYDSMETDCKVCKEASLMFGTVLFGKYGCDVELLNIKDILQISLTHYANIIYLNVNGVKKGYLVDLTYSQFFGDKIVLDDNTVVSTDIFIDIEQETWVQELRKNGFVELNENIYEQYKDTFVELCKTKQYG